MAKRCLLLDDMTIIPRAVIVVHIKQEMCDLNGMGEKPSK